jgi:hypothetical protein
MGTLRDSRGKAVTSGSGQEWKTRYDDDEDKASKASKEDKYDFESVKKPRSIEEQIGRKTEPKKEPKAENEEPRRKISDYISPSGVFSNVQAAVESATNSNQGSGDRTVSPVTAAANNNTRKNTRKSAVVKEAAPAPAPAPAPKKETADYISPRKIQEERRNIVMEKRERTKSPEFPSKEDKPPLKSLLKEDKPKESSGYISPKKIQEERSRIAMKKRESDKAATENRKEFGMKKGGVVSSASSRGDGIAQRGKTRGRLC